MPRSIVGTLRGALSSATAMKNAYPKVGPKASTTARTWMKRPMLNPVIVAAIGGNISPLPAHQQRRPVAVDPALVLDQARQGEGGRDVSELRRQQAGADERAGCRGRTRRSNSG